jgi:hypothetical protein
MKTSQRESTGKLIVKVVNEFNDNYFDQQKKTLTIGVLYEKETRLLKLNDGFSCHNISTGELLLLGS